MAHSPCLPPPQRSRSMRSARGCISRDVSNWRIFESMGTHPRAGQKAERAHESVAPCSSARKPRFVPRKTSNARLHVDTGRACHIATRLTWGSARVYVFERRSEQNGRALVGFFGAEAHFGLEEQAGMTGRSNWTKGYVPVVRLHAGQSATSPLSRSWRGRGGRRTR